MRGWKGLPGRNNLLEGLAAYGGVVVSGVSQALGVLLGGRNTCLASGLRSSSCSLCLY